jgi:hypothetical protein
MTQKYNWFVNSDGTDNSSEFDFNLERKKLIESLDKLKAMSVQEFTFFKKYEELKQLRNTNIAPNAFNTKQGIWKLIDPNDEEMTINQIESLDPEVIFVEENDTRYYDVWNHLRLFCHTMEFSQNPGRFLRFLIVDKPTKKYLGVLSIASDVIIITDRDKYIGWSMDNRLKDKMLAHSAIASCIMATQPFGYNFLGGKLMALLSTSKVVRDTWEKMYNQKLVGITTTSLYGSYSIYNSLNRWWHKCGVSAGKILIKPDQVCYDVWHQWLKDNKKEEYIKAMTQKEGVSGPVTAAKLRILSMIMKYCGIKQKDYVTGYLRGTYYSCFYENTKEFLQNKIKEEDLIMKPLFKEDVKSIMEWWRLKAIERFKRLFLENRVKPDTLFYDVMIDMSYEEAKEKFFEDVGR